MKKKGWMCIGCLLLSMPIWSQNQQSDYDNFRKNMLQDYSVFRKSVLDHYADFLAGVWKDYQTFQGYKRDSIPKPKVIPVMLPKDEPVKPNPVQPVIEPADPNPTPSVHPRVPIRPTIPTVVSPANVTPGQPETLSITFYGLTAQLPQVKLSTALGEVDEKTLSDYWRQLQSEHLAETLPVLKTYAGSHGFNDWCIYLFVEQYVQTLLPHATQNQLLATSFFLLANWGFDIRLGNSQGDLKLLIPFQQKVYEHIYLTLDGQNYYVFPDVAPNSTLSTCSLPEDVRLGNQLSLNLKGDIHLGTTLKPFLWKTKEMQIMGQVNEAQIKLMRHYPQTDIPEYARSRLDMTLRSNIVEQVRRQVSGMSELQAANAMLNFVQHAFAYSTDEEQFHQKEKPLMVEEMLYYPADDCEDRAIFYSYLIHEILKLDVHLVHYPGHECTGVAFSEAIPNSTSYEYQGKRYYITDPTYIGARAGMCMPDYRQVKPQLEFWY